MMNENDKTENAKSPEEQSPSFSGSMSALFSRKGPVSLQSAGRPSLSLGIDLGGQTGSQPPFSALGSALSVPAGAESGSSQARGTVRELIQQPKPSIHPRATLHEKATVLGNVVISADVYVGPGAVIVGFDRAPVFVGEGTYVQENAVIRGFSTHRDKKPDKTPAVEAGAQEYSVYIGSAVVICAQSQIHGPARIEDGVYVGAQSLVFWAEIGEGVVVEPGCLVVNVSVPSGVFIPAGLNVVNNRVVGDLPPLTKEYRFYGLTEEVLEEGWSRLRG